MTAPRSPGGQRVAIARPVVEVAHGTGGRTIARCGHCPWEYANTVKSDVHAQARYHRGLHRHGSIDARTSAP